MRLRGIPFTDAAKEVDQLVGSVQATVRPKDRSVDKVRSYLNRIWDQSVPDIGNPYLKNRGITVKPEVRYVERLEHFDGARTVHPAMIACVQSSDGKKIAIHRTYLTPDGRKANLGTPKKLTQTLSSIAGAAIRLFQHGKILGVAEGIETACAATQLFGIPTWSAISANGIKTFEPPSDVERLIIFADNDANQVGQKSAYELAARVRIPCEVRIPTDVGTESPRPH